MLNRSLGLKNRSREKTPTRGGAPSERIPTKTPGSAGRTRKTPGNDFRIIILNPNERALLLPL